MSLSPLQKCRQGQQRDYDANRNTMESRMPVLQVWPLVRAMAVLARRMKRVMVEFSEWQDAASADAI